MPTPAHIAVLTSTFPRYEGDPFPPFVFDLCRHLVPEFAVTVITPYCCGAKRRETMDGVEVIRYRYWWSDRDLLSDGGAKLPKIHRNPLKLLQVPGFVFGQFHALRRLAKEQPIDSIHAHWILPQGLVAVIYKLLLDRRVRVVITSHGADIFGLNPLGWIKRWVLNHADVVTGVSQVIAARIRELGVRKSLPIYVRSMGIDTLRFRPEAEDVNFKQQHGIDGPMLLFVGRLTEKKGLRFLIEALPDVIRSCSGCCLWIAGYGELRESLEQLACGLGLTEQNLRFGGQITHADLPTLYASADIFVGPSIVSHDGDTEGFGLVFAEAQASGCAVIATDLPAIRDIVGDERTGLLVPQKDSKALVRSILRLLGNADLRAAIREAALIHSRAHFSWPAVAANYAAWLQPRESPSAE